MKILICDAAPVLLAAIEFRLRKHGLEMLQVTNRTLSDTIEEEHPKLIIFDIEDSPASSLRLIQAIKNDSTATIPLIVISSIENETILWQALQMGVEDFVIKPFKPIELVVRVRRLLTTLGNNPHQEKDIFQL